jgi:hypothetical protein
MKNLFFTLALVLISSFAFANNGLTNQKSVISNEIENIKSNKVDFETISKMSKNDNFRIIEIIELDKSFLFLDDCGNWWIVEYDSNVYTSYTAFLTASQIIYDATGC